MHFRDSLVNLLRKQCLQAPQMAAEVGVHRGRTSYRLLTEFPKLHLYLVDLWGKAAVETSDPITRLSQEEQDKYFCETMDLMRHFPTRHEVLRMDFAEAVQHMQPLDCAFLDADHGFEGTWRALQAYWPIIRPQGLLCGHDYGKDDLPGVTLAVDDFAREQALDLTIEEGNIFWFRKP